MLESLAPSFVTSRNCGRRGKTGEAVREIVNLQFWILIYYRIDESHVHDVSSCQHGVVAAANPQRRLLML